MSRTEYAHDQYAEFAGEVFGKVLAEIARDQYEGVLTNELLRKARRTWNLTPTAHKAVEAKARELLNPH